MRPEDLKTLLESVGSGTVSPDEAMRRMKHLPFESLEGAVVDHHRQLRCGFPEVVYGPGKTDEQLLSICGSILASGQTLLVTRASAAQADLVTSRMPGVTYNAGARTLSRKSGDSPERGSVGIVAAGSSDIPVAEEAAVTAGLMGAGVRKIYDVGVAGLHRLLSRLPDLEEQDVLVVVAGMEGALPSVVGGLSAVPVIAVPTSVGYGAAFSGLTALLGMLNSCAAGVLVVNIDNGFGAGYSAGMIARTAAAGREPR